MITDGGTEAADDTCSEQTDIATSVGEISQADDTVGNETMVEEHQYGEDKKDSLTSISRGVSQYSLDWNAGLDYWIRLNSCKKVPCSRQQHTNELVLCVSDVWAGTFESHCQSVCHTASCF